jgi:hypothetical protein
MNVFLFGPACLVFTILGSRLFSIYAATLAVVVIDLTPLLSGFMGFDKSHWYGLMHTPVFGVLVALIVSAAFWKNERWAAIVGGFFGAMIHLPLHSAYTEQFAVELAKWGNRESAREASTEVETLCLIAFFIAGIVWAVKRIKNRNKYTV